MKFNITQKFINALKPPATGNKVYYDNEVPGFGVRITSAGVKSYILNYFCDGRERRYTIGRVGDWTEKHDTSTVVAARDEANMLRKNIHKGTDPLREQEMEAEAAEAVRDQPTMADLAREFMEQHAKWHKRPDSAHNDGLLLKNHILPKLGHLCIAAVTSRDIEALKISMRATPYAANRTLSLLSALFSFDAGKFKKCKCVGWKTRLDNPVLGIPHFPEIERDTPLNDEQLQALYDALAAYCDQNAADATRLLILTGARSQEVIRAEWSMFNLRGQGKWKRPASLVKEKAEENVPLNEAATVILRRMAVAAEPGQRFLFPGRTGEKPRVSLNNCWRAVSKAAGLSTCREVISKKTGRKLLRWKNNFRIHDLRHTYASFLANKGHSLDQIGALLGHRSAETTKRYAHYQDAGLRGVTNDFGAMLTNLTQ